MPSNLKIFPRTPLAKKVARLLVWKSNVGKFEFWASCFTFHAKRAQLSYNNKAFCLQFVKRSHRGIYTNA